MDRERNEDLNPHGEDIEEKVRRMLDPTVPDEADPPKPKKPVKPKISAPKVPPTKDEQLASVVSSAPTVPPKGSKAVSITVSHHDDELLTEEAAPIPPINKITIAEHDETPADVAEKLNEAIAELDESASKAPPAKEPVEKQPAEAAATAPPLPAAAKHKVSKKPETAAIDEKPEEVPGAKDNVTDEALPATAGITIGEAIERAQDAPTLEDPAILKDPATDKAVDDIVASESDEILEIEDAIRDTDEPFAPAKAVTKPTKKEGKKPSLFKSRVLRWILVLLVLSGLLAAVGLPKSRYLLLNTAGVRAESSLTVLDDSTQQPLKNVQVSIGDATGTTNAQGEVTLTKVKLGTNLLTIQKRAFAPFSKTVVIGWGSNPLQSYALTPTGTQYEFTTLDYLSGKPIPKVEASSLEADAISNEQGVLKLTLDKPSDDTPINVTFKHEGYRDETLQLSPADKTNHTIKMVPAAKDLFVSKRSGKYDLYSSYIDGKDEKIVLAGTGTERDDMVLVPHPTEPIAAYVSTRGGQHNSQGYLLSTLTIINTDDNTTHDVVAAERIQLIDWSGDNLVYVQIASGESASSPKRYRLMSYNQKTTATKELAASNYFNDVVSVNGDIYYAPSSAYQSTKTALYKVKADGTGSQTVFTQEVWNIIRTSYDHLALAVEQQWYDYVVGDKQPQKLNAAPASQQPRVYIISPNGKQAAWVDVRDGKGVLLVYDPATKNDTTIDSKSGLTYPVRWLNNTTLVYRVKNDQETADYAVSLSGGKPTKVRDVTNAGGIDRWYYY